MNTKILDLTEENLAEAPEWEAYPFSCKYCLYWEHPELCLDPAAGVREERFAKKLAWLRRVRKEWGSCGKLLFVGNEPVGYAQYAPAQFFPGALEYPAGPVSEDAVLLACLFITNPPVAWARAGKPPSEGDPGRTFSARVQGGGDLRPPGERRKSLRPLEVLPGARILCAAGRSTVSSSAAGSCEHTSSVNITHIRR